MISRTGLLLFLLISFVLPLSGQNMTAFTSPGIDDGMTLNPDQNKKWRKGLYKYGAKPKSAWELGIHFGHYTIDGDVDRKIPGGFGVGLHLRKAIQYVLSFRVDLFYGEYYGVDAKLWTHGDEGGGLVEDVFADYQYVEGWFPKVKTHYGYVSVQSIINIGNILFHQEKNKWNWYLILGVGLDTHQAMLDLYDAYGDPYDVTPILNKGYDRDIRAERIMIKNDVDKLYDGEYDTQGPQKEGIFRIADTYNVHMLFVGGTGISYKINKRVNIGLEHQFMATDNDYLDGILYREVQDQSNNVDIGHYTSLRLGVNLGNLDKRTEPLYWLNPLDATFNDIAELKQRPVLDLTDTDADGIIDMLDMEPDSPMGAKVDTRGITTDSDGDGVADFEDKEPYSAPGVKIDETGKSIDSREDFVKRDEVIQMIEKVNEKLSASSQGASAGIPNWYLPMIHFDLDKYYIKPEYYGDMKHIAQMMNKFPELCVTVSGHTDSRHSNQYNEALSYKRAQASIDFLVDTYEISRDRFRLMYGGEEKPLVPGLPPHHNITKEKEQAQFMNRRVEFRICEETDFDMEAPEFLDAGKNSYGSSRKGPKYSGNKNSGY